MGIFVGDPTKLGLRAEIGKMYERKMCERNGNVRS
jgi:hypothetical protein